VDVFVVNAAALFFSLVSLTMSLDPDVGVVS